MVLPFLFVISLGLIQNIGMGMLLLHRFPLADQPVWLIFTTAAGMLPLLSGLFALYQSQKLHIPHGRRALLARMFLLLAVTLSVMMQYLGWRQFRATSEAQLVFLFFPFYASMAHLTFSQVVLAFYRF